MKPFRNPRVRKTSDMSGKCRFFAFFRFSNLTTIFRSPPRCRKPPIRAENRGFIQFSESKITYDFPENPRYERKTLDMTEKPSVREKNSSFEGFFEKLRQVLITLNRHRYHFDDSMLSFASLFFNLLILL